MLSEYKFTVVTRPGQGHANADGLSRCLPPNGLTKAFDVVEDDEPKVFSLMAEGQHEETSNISDLSTIKARLSVDYFADENYHDIMETLKNDMINEEVV